MYSHTGEDADMCMAANVFEVTTVDITWDSLHIILTLAIYVTLIIFIWVTRIDPCRKSQTHEIIKETDSEIPRCLALTWQV